MILLPLWALLCLCMPSFGLGIMLFVGGIAALIDHRKAYKEELRAEIEREKEKTDADN